MLDPIQNQLSSTNALSPLNQSLMQKPLPFAGFPLQNLALMPVMDEQLLQGAMVSNNRISLTPQSFANIITNSIIKVVESMMNIFMERLQGLFGQTGAAEAIGSATGAGVTAPADPAAVSGTESAVATQEGVGTVAGGEAATPTFMDGVKNIFSRVTDFLFGSSGGFLDFAKDVVLTLLPGLGTLSLPKLLQKFKSLGKGIQALFKGGKEALGGLISQGKDWLSGAIDAGKKLLKKIF